MSSSRSESYRLLFANPSFRHYTLARFVLLSSTWMERLAYGWLAWDMTHSEAWLGTLAAVEMITTLMVTPVAGVWADRLEPLKLLKQSQLGAVAITALLVIFIQQDLTTIYLLVLFVIAKTAFAAIAHPVSMSMINELVDRDKSLIGSAVAFNSMTLHLSRFIGPAIAGVLIVGGGAAIVLMVTMGCSVFFLAVIHWRVTLARERLIHHRQGSLLEEIRSGLRYATRHTEIAPILVLAAATTPLFRFYPDLLPAIADTIFFSGAQGLATLAAASGLGGMAGAILISLRHRNEGLMRLTLNISFGTGIFLILFSNSDILWVGAIFIALMTVTDVIMGTGLQILAQTRVDDEYRGRVISLLGLIIRIGPSSGAFVLGLLASRIPLPYSMSLFAVLGIATVIFIRRKASRQGDTASLDKAD